MNTQKFFTLARIIGFLSLGVAISLQYIPNSWNLGFVSGFLIGLGIVLIITGKFKLSSGRISS